MDEVWKDISGYEGIYQVSNLGRVKSLDREISHLNRWGSMQSQKIRGRILTAKASHDNYMDVVLCKGGRSETKLVHRLVAIAFIPNPDNLPQVNHKDENPRNNAVTNLEWCTAEYNSNYGNRNAKLSCSQKGKIVSDETRQKMHERRLGSGNPMYGRTQSEESRERISKALKGVKRSPEYIENLRQRMKGNIPWNKGKHARKVICLDANIIFDSCEDAAKWVGDVTPEAIQYVLKRIACCKGHVFVYSDSVPEDVSDYVRQCREHYRGGSKAGRPCKCVEDNITFRFVSEAAKHYTVAYEKVRSHLDDREGVLLPDGRVIHFERVPFDD